MDDKGRPEKFCPCGGFAKKKCTISKKQVERIRSAPPGYRNYYGYLYKIPTPTSGIRDKKKATGGQEETGLLGQLKGIFSTRDGVVARVYRHFEEEPIPKPTHVCFETQIMFSHREVMQTCSAVLRVIANIDGSKVIALQYVPQKVQYHNREIGDRWVVELSSRFAVKKLIEAGLTIRGVELHIRPLDSVLTEEYKQFLGLHKMAKLMLRPMAPERLLGARHSARP